MQVKQSELFVLAKRAMRADPEATDEDIALKLSVHPADVRSMDTIRTARRDVAAG